MKCPLSKNCKESLENNKSSRKNCTIFAQICLFFIYNSLFWPHLHYDTFAWRFSCYCIVKLQKEDHYFLPKFRWTRWASPHALKHCQGQKHFLSRKKIIKFYYRYCMHELPGNFLIWFETCNTPISPPKLWRWKLYHIRASFSSILYLLV